MVCYARLYGRDVNSHRDRLWKELSNLNNRVIVLLPDWSVIRHRYHHRGDEIQDIDSLHKLYGLFLEETEKIRDLPNVIVIEDEDGIQSNTDVTLNCLDEIYNLENQNPDNLGDVISKFVGSSGRKEVSPLNFSVYFDDIDKFDHPEIMEHPPERDYYAKIKKGVLENIKKELAGENDYGVPQSSETTRRFIYTQDSCISLVHTMLREGYLNVHVVCRSSDVINTFPYDLKFLIHLAARARSYLGLKIPVRLRCAMNSAHIVD